MLSNNNNNNNNNILCYSKCNSCPASLKGFQNLHTIKRYNRKRRVSLQTNLGGNIFHTHI